MPCLLMLIMPVAGPDPGGDVARCCLIPYSTVNLGKMESLCSWATSGRYVPGQAVGCADEMAVEHMYPCLTFTALN